MHFILCTCTLCFSASIACTSNELLANKCQKNTTTHLFKCAMYDSETWEDWHLLSTFSAGFLPSDNKILTVFSVYL